MLLAPISPASSSASAASCSAAPAALSASRVRPSSVTSPRSDASKVPCHALCHASAATPARAATSSAFAFSPVSSS